MLPGQRSIYYARARPGLDEAFLSEVQRAGTRLEDDAAAAHAGLTRDADAASAALHAGFSEQCDVPWNAIGLTR